MVKRFIYNIFLSIFDKTLAAYAGVLSLHHLNNAMRQNFLKGINTLVLLGCSLITCATEGMWLPHLLQSLNEKEMRQMGMKMRASDIYNVNKGSLKDAIVSFGGFCTGEIISNEGLLLTNHHCGYGSIQERSSLSANYLEDGFWASNKAAELPNPKLFVTFIVRIEDVTASILKEVQPQMDEATRNAIIEKNIKAVQDGQKLEAFQSALIRPFFSGNQYFLFITERFNDVRLVGTPPSSIGKFGADTDNWVWPRHTGDFALFRVYASKDNKPADYSLENVPYKPKHFLPISMSGVEEGDFTMVMGFPGRTNEYLPGEAVRQIVQLQDPAKIAMRDVALKITDQYMRQDPQIKLQYAAKFASTANAWKKWQGEVLGVNRTKGLDRKAQYEASFRSKATPAQQAILDSLGALYKRTESLSLARDYYAELIRNAEILNFADDIVTFVINQQKADKSKYAEALDRFMQNLRAAYENFSPVVDQEVTAALLDLYFKSVPSNLIGGAGTQEWMRYNKQGSVASAHFFQHSKLVRIADVEAFLKQPLEQLNVQIWQDPAIKFLISLRNGHVELVGEPLAVQESSLFSWQRQYMQAQMDVFKDRRFYPDANSTLRVTYGKVDPYSPRDAVDYGYITTLEGMIEKYVPGDYEFDLPVKLLDLYKRKDYGPYAVNGQVPVCFIASNHTTGGNSGSPAIDAWGNLIGLNFDRTWEGTMSDINYDPSICRNIMVDIRFILFIIDKYAGATHLIEELQLVYPKGKSKKIILRNKAA
jgi:hypothetical protein